MMLVTSGKARLFALVALATLGVAPFARANINDYEFTTCRSGNQDRVTQSYRCALFTSPTTSLFLMR